MIETLSLLGSLMVGLESESLRQQVSQTLADFYRAESNDAKAEGIPTKCRRLLSIASVVTLSSKNSSSEPENGIYVKKDG